MQTIRDAKGLIHYVALECLDLCEGGSFKICRFQSVRSAQYINTATGDRLNASHIRQLDVDEASVVTSLVDTQHVARLYVAVNHAVTVHVCKCLHQLAHCISDLGRRQGSASQSLNSAM